MNTARMESLKGGRQTARAGRAGSGPGAASGGEGGEVDMHAPWCPGRGRRALALCNRDTPTVCP